ncbi:Ferric reductase like transmembrane component [Novipirellula aureliae]|uniref:Ferric reductase like transmembrane component n=1 Tax=Novipirellula aureliae TaxID=2527966 RepID=A0A5C6E8H7_9BACT|nr:ferric reductase-like transmembrane domain-containing protein [Novipirellula aureliae]TWU43519.1 Ferric reductase like transmembrane component [Novipirellula aureliae]
MKVDGKTFAIASGLAMFIGLPLLLYATGDAPGRSALKESLSILTLLAFSLMLSQFFLARSNVTLISLFKPRQIQRFHKVIAYGAVAVILVHPFLIVLPRYFEAGIEPWDAFVTMMTTFESRGILLGMAAWVLLLSLSISAFFRVGISKHLPLKYRGWRYLHSVLAISMVVVAIWHAIDLGRHTDVAMSVFFIAVTVLGVAMLANLYWGAASEKSPETSKSQGSQT